MFVDTGRELGWGSFGIVNEGKWRDKKVAIKTMKLQHKDSSSTEETIAREQQKNKFKKEASLTYSLNHKNIVKVFGLYLELRVTNS